MNNIIDNTAGPTGIIGVIVGRSPHSPSEWLVHLSTILVLIQIIHWAHRLFKWVERRKDKSQKMIN